MKLQEYWYPIRWGIKTRKALLKFASSYGGRFYKIRRPIAVFIAELLDEKHQEIKNINRFNG